MSGRRLGPYVGPTPRRIGPTSNRLWADEQMTSARRRTNVRSSWRVARRIDVGPTSWCLLGLTDVGASAIGSAINKEFNLMDAGCWPLHKFHLDPSNRLATVPQCTNVTDRQTGQTDRETTVWQHRWNRFTNGRPI